MHLPGYRIWVATTIEGVGSHQSVDRIAVQPATGAEEAAIDVRRRRLTLGIAGSHGIIEPLRVRFPEWIFSDLPAENFQVVLYTNTGVERYPVAHRDPTMLLRVCN